MTLPKEMIEIIEKQSEHYANVKVGEKAKHIGHPLSHRWDDANDDYEAGATEWAAKAKPLADAVQGLIDEVDTEGLTEDRLNELIAALAKYKEVSNG